MLARTGACLYRTHAYADGTLPLTVRATMVNAVFRKAGSWAKARETATMSMASLGPTVLDIPRKLQHLTDAQEGQTEACISLPKACTNSGLIPGVWHCHLENSGHCRDPAPYKRVNDKT